MRSRTIETEPLAGLSSAPVIYVNGIARIRFLGVNTHFQLYADDFEGERPVRKAAVVLIGPSGGLVSSAQTLMNFIKENLPGR